METNYYKLLELTDEDKKLPQEEFQKKIKKNYKKLAMQYHPDRFTDDNAEKKEAEEKFKEISVAYNTLNDPAKRQEYDTFGVNGSHGRGFNMSPEELHRMMRNAMFGFGFNNATRPKGQSHRVNVSLTLKEIYTGTHKKIKYKRLEKCSHCDGSGADKNGRVEACSKCNGTGEVMFQQGFTTYIHPCPECGGTGKHIINPCKKCNGTGLSVEEATAEFDVPAGVSHGMMLKLVGMGSAPNDPEGDFGDLIVVITEQKDSKFQRDDYDLICMVDVPLIDCLLGTSVEVKNIDDKKYKVMIKPGTKHLERYRLQGKGLPYTDNQNYRGNLIIVVNQIVPKEFNKEEKELLGKLKKMEHFKK